MHRLNLAPPQQLYDRLVAGGIAGAVSRTLVAPLERCAALTPLAPCQPQLSAGSTRQLAYQPKVLIG